ncbi:hypothetical protein IF188_06730 [Microbacterium sp. NEAU-LLC]|uniref:DUF2975 domain-containing protein n=1 Tax=Microbacterium helvum TaxID=2773713 RepID=A0ABR8NPC1_9MICO|nr:hypothetical protein [Microbacterium helvum]MBD3941391.1 hypothetical protein [Microbacterium helvum]
MTTYMPIVMAVITMALPIVLIVAVFRARKTQTATPVVRIALIVSASWAGITLLGATYITVLWFSPNVYPWFTLRSATYWPVDSTYDPLAAEVPSLMAGGFTTAEVGAAGLSASTRTILAAGDLTGSLVTVALASLVAIACWRFMQGHPFAPEIARLSILAAAICLVGGFAAQVLSQWGGTLAADEIIRAGQAPAGLEAASGLSLDFWPLFAAIGLGAFAALARYGTSLQRETEGLV